MDLAFKWPSRNEGVLVSPVVPFPKIVNCVVHGSCILTILYNFSMGCLLDMSFNPSIWPKHPTKFQFVSLHPGFGFWPLLLPDLQQKLSTQAISYTGLYPLLGPDEVSG